MKVKKIPIESSVGMRLAHDVTKIVPGKFKGPAFKKGHLIEKEDIPEFLSLGKKQVYVLELSEGEVHEDEAGIRLAKAEAGFGIKLQGPKEGKVNLIAEIKGLLQVNKELLEKINSIDGIILSTLHNFMLCTPGMLVGGTKIIPLVIKEDKIKKVEDLYRKEGPVMNILPFKEYKVGVVITGNEIFEGRVEDKFGGILHKKIEALGSHILAKVVSPDDKKIIAKNLINLKKESAQLILVTGGMSVDPDDVTLASIKSVGADIESYGSPVLPGAMFLLAYWDGVPVLGVPACAIYYKRTVLDIILPRILAGIKVTKKDIIKLGYGGLCLNCSPCTYPKCYFGKG